MGWVSFEHNPAVCVDKDDMGDALNFELLVSCAAPVRSQVVLDVGPTLVRDARFELVHILVETQANDPDFVTPSVLIV